MALKITGTNTAAAPGITGDDTDTGLFYASDALGFSTGGTERLRLNGSSLGLNTASPAFPSGEGLEIYSSANPRLKLSNSTTGTSGTDGTQIYLSNANTIIDNKDSGDILIHTNADEKVRITSAGDVGIGTTTVLGDSKVHIKDSATGGYRPLVVEGSATNGSVIEFRNNGATRIRIGSAGGNNLSGSSATDGLIRSEANMIFAVGNSEKLRIDSSGRVLIKQSTGTSNLCVSDTNPVIAEFHHSDGSTNDQARISLGALANNPPSNRGVNLVGENNGAGHDFVVQCSPSHSGGPTEALRVHSNGDITVPSGSIKLSESGQGINFHAHGTGSGVSNNLLDDYEEGTWDPTVAGWDTFTPYTGSSYDYGWYVKIGALVYFGWKLYIQTLSTLSTSGSGPHIRFTGLPFASKDVTSQTGPKVRFDIPEFGTENYVWSYIGGNDTTVYMYSQASGAGSSTALNATGNRSNAWTMAWGSYMTNA